jgi:CRP-like cAMP-binding protein
VSIDVIESFTFIEGFTQDQIKILQPLIEEIHYQDQQVVFRQGERADYLYFVLEGRVSIQFKPEDGPVLSVSEVVEGDVFGWSSALGSACYTSSAICLEGGRFVRIEGSDLKDLCQKHPETGILILNRLAGVIAQRLRGTHQQVVKLLQKGLKNQGQEECRDETD